MRQLLRKTVDLAGAGAKHAGNALALLVGAIASIGPASWLASLDVTGLCCCRIWSCWACWPRS
jgi:hypothetical protein